jgi:hypothetical protein
MIYFFALLISPILGQQLEQCISEYNNLLQQCQSEINRAGGQLAALTEQTELQTIRLAALEAEQVGLFSWRYIRRHVDFVFPEYKDSNIIPSEYWNIYFVPFVDLQLRPNIAFLSAAPAEDLLFFSSLVSLVVVRLVFFLASLATKSPASCPVATKKK